MMHSPSFPLFQSEATPCLRCADPTPALRPDGEQLRIRVLLINGADPNDGNIQADKEATVIESILAEHEHAFDVESVRTSDRKASWDIPKLEQKIRIFAPHVLHFIGHSEAASSGNPAAVVVHNGNTYLRWQTPQIAAFLLGILSLRLSYLNACRTQMRTPLDAEKSALSPNSLGEVFLQRSLAVIAMQFDVRGSAAALCAETFYRHLTEGFSIDQAICVSRRTLSAQFGAATREPYLPSLVVRAHPDHVLALRPGTLNRTDVEENVKPVTRHFVNHRMERRVVHDLLFGPPPNQRRMTVLTGSDGVGKTWLLKWMLYTLGLRGVRVHYIEKPADNWLDVLRQIRDKGTCLLSEGCFDLDQINRFNRALQLLSRGEPVTAYNGGAVQDSNRSLGDIMNGEPKPVNDFPERLCAEMLSIFDSGSETVCAIDHWDPGSRETEETPQTLYRHLFQPLLRRKSSPVRLLLSITHRRIADPHVADDFPGWGVQPVNRFRPEELPDLAEQLLRKMYGKQVDEEHVSFVRKKAKGNLSARELHENLENLRGWIE
jgi:hypothetical protein